MSSVKVKNLLIVAGSTVVSIALIQGVFALLSLQEPGLQITFSAMLAATFAHDLTKKYQQD